MNDTSSCLICGIPMRSINMKNKHLSGVNKTSDYIERTCAGYNHTLSFWSDILTNQVDLLKVSLNRKYSQWVDIDFINQKSRISCFNNSIPEYIYLPSVPELDFPNLLKLKEIIQLYITFS